jgi:bifunctional oligoribonuclease and PAP phosphatase NrnA
MDLFDKIINENNKFIISTHVNPDGDAIGSSMALYYYLQDLGKEASIINCSETSRYYKFLDPDNIIIKYSGDEIKKIQEADIIFLLDLNDPVRIKTMGEAVLNSPVKKVIIDHHSPGESFSDYEFASEEASSTGEVLYRLLSKNGEKPLTERIAVALYTAIMTDTLSFHLPKSTSELYRIAANLIDWGAKPTEIYYQVYERDDIRRFHLLGEVINSFTTIHNGRVLYMMVNQKMFAETGTKEPDIDNFIDYGLKVDGVKIVIFFVELKDGVKISFRSRGNIAVNELAQQFNGNGHKNAAGTRLFNTNLSEVMPLVLEKAKYYLP